MNSFSFIFAVLIILGYIFHSTMHPEDVITGSHSEHFTPSLAFYFVPAQAAHFPYNIINPIFSAFLESSVVITVVSAAVMIIFGSQVEKTIVGGSNNNNNIDSHDSSSGPSFLNNNQYSASLTFFGKIFLLSHGTFLVVSFLTSAMSSALVKSTHPHPEKEKHEQEETIKVGYAYFGPLAFSCGVAVVAWCRNSISNNPSEDEGDFSSLLSSASSSTIQGSGQLLSQPRFVPFYLIVLALVRDLFFGDHPPTHSEFMLGIATRGPLFLGVFCAMLNTWFYFRFMEPRTEFQQQQSSSSSSSSPSLITLYGNASGRFALHRGCPVPVLSEKALLPVSSFFFSKILRVFTSYGKQVDAKWVEFLEIEKQNREYQKEQEEGNNGRNNNNNPTGGARSRRSSFKNDQSNRSVFSSAQPPEGTTVVDVPRIANPEADRRRELAMAALRERMKRESGEENDE